MRINKTICYDRLNVILIWRNSKYFKIKITLNNTKSFFYNTKKR